MHLLIPYAYVDQPACTQALDHLELPVLQSLLRSLREDRALEDEALTGEREYTLNTPAERVSASALGWHAADGQLPFAARAAERAGWDARGLPWGRLTPMYWHAGRDHLTALPLELEGEGKSADASEARALFDSARPLFTSLDWHLEWLRPDCWLVAHNSLAGLATASLDRVAGRNPDAWMPEQIQARPIKRLQNEVQMLWHDHPVNEARAQRGAPAINSVWLSDCGYHQDARGAEPTCVEHLRASAWQGDWSAWRRAWEQLDREVLPALVQASSKGEGARLTLAGERGARTWGPRTSPWHSRFFSSSKLSDVALVLKSL